MKVPEQIKRLAVVLFVIIAAVLLTWFLVPASVVDRRIQQESTVKRVTSTPIQFAGTAVCGECHDDETAKKKKGFHKGLSCETCHGPALKHVEDPGTVKPFAPRERKFCPLCHAYDPSRPTGFPQINPTIHNPLKPCITCHNPHDPEPPNIPRECSACHAEIARTKALSRHALLACTTCHTVPTQHKQAPRSVRPTKPEAREFCAKCHDKGSTQKAAPKVDAATHGGRYLCWQCHYPHMPGEA
jgi:hypothetical protein